MAAKCCMPPELELVAAWLHKADNDLRNISNNLQAEPQQCDRTIPSAIMHSKQRKSA